MIKYFIQELNIQVIQLTIMLSTGFKNMCYGMDYGREIINLTFLENKNFVFHLHIAQN